MTDMTTANTILAQLGGNRFIAMTGCKNFGGHADALSFHMPQRMCINKAKFCKITLNANDLYDVKFQKMTGGKFGELVTVSEFSNVFAEDLRELFTAQTGLATSLGSMRA